VKRESKARRFALQNLAQDVRQYKVVYMGIRARNTATTGLLICPTLDWISSVKPSTHASKTSQNSQEKSTTPDCEPAGQVPEGKFRQAFDNAPIGMAVIDFNFRFRRVNAALCRALDYSAAELLQQRLADVTHADDVSRGLALTNQLLHGEIPSYRIEKRFIKRNGSIAWLDVTAVLMRDDDGVPLYGLAMVEDITDRKHGEEALRASEERYRSFVVNSSEGIWRLDVEEPIDVKLPVEEQSSLFYKCGYLAECNDAMARMHGYERSDDIVGKRFGDSKFASHPANTSVMRKLIANKYRLLDLQTAQFDSEGGTRYFSSNLIGIIVQGMLLRVWGVQRDQTELRTASLKLEHSHQQLRQLSGHLQRLREKEKANLSRELHDSIGQALAGIKIQTALLKKSITTAGHVDVEQVTQVLDEIGRSVDETARSVKAISTELRPGVLDKFGLAAAIEWQCEEMSRRLKIECKSNVPQQELKLPADMSTALFRILQEALTNVAVHANADVVNVDLALTESTVTLTITDNGRGRDQSSKLARSFGHARTRRVPQGFIQRFRHAGSRHHDTSNLQPQTRHSRSHWRWIVTNVLIVDDHPIVRRGLKQVLQDEPDLSVTEAGHAREALDQIKHHAIDLVIVDIDLPGMNGIELLKEIKRENKQTPVLMLSIYPEDQVAVRVLRAGASGFLSKEAAPEQLVVAIRKILDGGKHISERVADLLVMNLGGTSEKSLHEKLSDREFQILSLFGEGKTVKQIAESLSLSVPTVSTYRARILNKMEMKSTAELVRYAIQNRLSNPK
jgi:two-component system, NarL family, invasion response regulator UvrY